MEVLMGDGFLATKNTKMNRILSRMIKQIVLKIGDRLLEINKITPIDQKARMDTLFGVLELDGLFS